MSARDMVHETAADLLASWDAGDIIWTLSMGGLGPGYEQAIQTMAVEFTRAGIASGWKPSGDNEADNKAWRAICDERMRQIDDAIGGASGAQFGAACWLAYQWLHNGGPRALAKRADEQQDEDRVIMCSKAFPREMPPMPEKAGAK